jgi:hypothetical protein
MITEKQPSASVKPVIQLGSNLLAEFLIVLNLFTFLNKNSKEFIKILVFPVKTKKKLK